MLEEVKQERRLRPVGGEPGSPSPAPVPRLPTRSPSLPLTALPPPGFGSLPCILNACSGDLKSTSCINLSTTDAGGSTHRPRPRVLLKAPTLAEMEEMNTSEVRARRLLRRDHGWGNNAGERAE